MDSYGEIKTLSDTYLANIKANNPQVKVLLTDKDLDLDFTDLTTAEALNNAKSKLDTKIAEIIGAGVPIYLNSNGYGQNVVQSSTETTSLQDELLLYLNTKLKDSFSYDNPGSTPDASPLDVINRTQFSTDQDVNNKKEEC
jgi:hypothetical protein